MASVYSVSQVNSYIRNMFTQDFMLAHIFVKGEVSNCKYHSSGHVYFTIKDTSSAMACVMFAGNRKSLNFTLKEGQKVMVEGSVTIYERDGKYQLYAKNITLDGTGVLYQRYEELKSRLEEMGMFSEEYKKPIPKYAKKIGIVTARTGAAIQDILNISKRRNPYVELILYSALVQGDGAKESIVRGIEVLDEMNLDILIVGRGGGSIEDLWAFNEECVARAMFNCKTPVISAVGHEVDVTIADYVADLRAPTPSAAAELAVFDYYQLLEKLEGYGDALNGRIGRNLSAARNRLEQCEYRLKHKSPDSLILEKRQRLISIADRLESFMEGAVSKKRHMLALYGERLNGLSPLKRLEKGYAYVSDQAGKPIRSTGSLKPGDKVMLQFKDGRAGAEIIGKEDTP